MGMTDDPASGWLDYVMALPTWAYCTLAGTVGVGSGLWWFYGRDSSTDGILAPVRTRARKVLRRVKKATGLELSHCLILLLVVLAVLAIISYACCKSPQPDASKIMPLQEVVIVPNEESKAERFTRLQKVFRRQNLS